MSDDRGTLREISWRELLPCLLLVRVFRIAAHPRMLVLAAVGVFLTVGGWKLLDQVFSGTSDARLAIEIQEYSRWPWLGTTSPAPDVAPDWLSMPSGDSRPVIGPWERLSRPFRQMFSGSVTFTALVVHFLAGLWATAVWAFFGGAICRLAAVRLAADEQVGIKDAVLHAQRKWPAYFFGPAATLLVVVAGSLLTAGVGWLLTWEWGIVVLGLFWPVLLLLAVLAVLVLAGLLLGWPLMWATIATERSDHFDALSRSFSYVFGRPLHYLFYLAVAALLGLLGWILLASLAEAVVYLTAWAVSWGVGTERFVQIMDNVPRPMPSLFEGPPPPFSPTEELGAIGAIGLAVIRFWCVLVQMLVVGFVYSFFWTSACGIYLLLRFHRDGTEIDEVDLDEQALHELSELDRDSQDVPVAPEETNGEE